jgi:2-dehydro-3-deoxy-D-arabinonate dehydratase
MKLYRTSSGNFFEEHGSYYLVDQSIDALIDAGDLLALAKSTVAGGKASASFDETTILPPIESQEVWASGVTYYRSRNARMEESKDAGGGDFYDRVYAAERPELFFKASGHRVVGTGGNVRIRRDATWSVPEPELTLVINPRGEIIGFTIGNDMSSRDIEGENPLYLPQAKVYNRSCSLGPCILLSNEPMPTSTVIQIQILREAAIVFSGETTLSELKRDVKTLVSYLYREMSFDQGAFLMTGTGVVPPDAFTLQSGDQIRITIEPIGVLINTVE